MARGKVAKKVKKKDKVGHGGASSPERQRKITEFPSGHTDMMEFLPLLTGGADVMRWKS